MKKLILSSLGGIAALAVVSAALASSAGAVSTPTLRSFCTTGPIRCLSALRTDIPIVPQAEAAHSGYGPADLQAAYRLASYAATRGGTQTVGIVDAYDDPTIESDLNV